MAKKKTSTTPSDSPPVEQPKKAAPSRRFIYTGPLCNNLVLRKPTETIRPMKMTDEEIESFLKRRPSAAKYWKDTSATEDK